MTNFPLKYRPGVCKNNSSYTSKSDGGRFTDMDGVRFSGGLPEQINSSLLVDLTSNIPENIVGVFEFVAANGTLYYALGTTTRLWRYDSGSGPVDITPLRGILSSTLSNPFDTTSGDATVNVNHTAHGLSTGDYVLLVGASTVGGLTIEGIYHVTVTGVDDYTIEASSNATSTVTGGGGTTSYTYYRVTLGNNPFETTNGSANVVVTHTSHGAITGDYVTFSGAATVGGITISGSYRITKLGDNTYRITHSSAANADATGGGAAVTARYDVSITSLFDGYDYLTDTTLWSLDNYGNQLLASPVDGTIYIWDSTQGGRAWPMYNAPTGIKKMFVTPERFVFALGNSSNDMQVKWPDQDDYTQWTTTPTNTANSRTLQGGSKLVGGIALRDGVSMVFSNTTPFTFTYRGDEFIYESNPVGSSAGLCGPLAVCVSGGVAYWSSGREFFMYGGGIENIPAEDVKDFIFSNIAANLTSTATQAFLSVMGTHENKNEIWYLYGTTAGELNNKHAICHLDQGYCWSTGAIPTSAWVEARITGCPLRARYDGMSLGNKLYRMDISTATGIDSAANFITYSPLEIGEGDADMEVFGFIPDMQAQTQPMNVVITMQKYPGDSIATEGTYALATNASIIDTRFDGRLVGYTISYTGTAASYWRMGVPRVDIQQSGMRR